MIYFRETSIMAHINSKIEHRSDLKTTKILI